MNAPRRILIIRTSALGDVARTVPALLELSRAYPDAAIDWLVHEQYTDAVAAHPNLHAAVGFPRKRLAALPGVVRRLRAARYDLAIDLEGQARSALLTRLSGSPLRVGYANAREGAAVAYNRTAYVSPAIHTVNRMLTLLHATNLTPRTERADMTLYVPPQALHWHDQHMPQEPYVAIAPTSKALCKCWPIDRFAAIAKRLRDQGRRIVVLVAPHERDYAAPLIEACEALCPQTSVAQFMAVIARARLLLCNDSAALHIAVGLGTPAVALFGPTNPARVGPYNQSHAVIQPPRITPHEMTSYRKHKTQTIIARITTDTVWHHLQSALTP